MKQAGSMERIMLVQGGRVCGHGKRRHLTHSRVVYCWPYKATTRSPLPSSAPPPLKDNSDGRRRVVAVKTLGFIVSSCGNVMGPYLEYPQLLSVLLRMLHEGHPAQRREVIKVRVCGQRERAAFAPCHTSLCLHWYLVGDGEGSLSAQRGTRLSRFTGSSGTGLACQQTTAQSAMARCWCL